MAPSIHYHDAINALREIALYGDTVHIGHMGKDETKRLAVEIKLVGKPRITHILVDNAPPHNPLGLEFPTDSDKLVALIKEAYRRWCKKRDREPKEI